MKLATWNLNSIRAREGRLLEWLAAQQPDVVCLQELKVVDEAFPFDSLRAAGYHSAVLGQRTYSGVAILSREEPLEVERGFAGDPDPAQSRLIGARFGDVFVLSAYFPNGGEIGTERAAYKVEWMKRLREHLDRRFDPKQPLALCGDFNVAPEERDVHDPKAWQMSVLFHKQMRAALEHVRGFGLVDVFRRHNAGAGLYSWWDYRMLAFPKDRGLRIDHIYATLALAARSSAAFIDRPQRKGQQPSDHAPVIAEFQ